MLLSQLPLTLRYNLKQSKAKLTLDDCNNFLDNDFTYVDDVDKQGDSNNHSSIKAKNISLKWLDGHRREPDKWQAEMNLLP